MRGFSRRGRFLVLLGVFCAGVVGVSAASPSYKSVLKKWTRHDEAYSFNNLEARLKWHATFLGFEFRQARRERLGELYEWTSGERQREERKDLEELKRYDDFFLGVYAGSSSWPEVGKDSMNWRILLEVPGREPVVASKFEEIRVTQTEKVLYPYLDKWSKAYRARFPKTITDGAEFRLRFPGIPARSELVWKRR